MHSLRNIYLQHNAQVWNWLLFSNLPYPSLSVCLCYSVCAGDSQHQNFFSHAVLFRQRHTLSVFPSPPHPHPNNYVKRKGKLKAPPPSTESSRSGDSSGSNPWPFTFILHPLLTIISTVNYLNQLKRKLNFLLNSTKPLEVRIYAC